MFEDTTPLVEGLSIDEAFLDVRGLERVFGTPVEIAERLRRDVLERVGLPITVGVARTKFLAKVASGVAKPDGLLVVPPDEELAFLHPLPVERLWGVGPVTAAKLRSRGIATVGRSRGCRSPCSSRCSAARPAAHLHALAHNRDPRPVRTGRRRGLDRVAAGARPRRRRRPRRSTRPWSGSSTGSPGGCGRPDGSAARSCSRLRFDDFTRATRSHTLPRPTAQTHTILATARGLLAAATPMIEQRGLTLVGVAVANLENDAGGAADAAVRPSQRRRARCGASTRSASASAPPRSRAPCCSAAAKGSTMPLLPD